MKLFNRFVHRPEQPTPAAPVPFDDGLVEFARLIDVDDPVKAVADSPADRERARRG